MSGGAHRAQRRRPGQALRHLVVLVVAICVTGTTTAWGYWTASPAVGGSGATAATSVNPGATPATSVSGQSVTVSWTASTLANGQPVTGYLVKRYDADTLTSQTVGAGCASVTSTSCTETGVPAGSWRYSITPVIGTNWRGAESGKSQAVTVVVPDTTAPTNSVSLVVNSGDASLTGSTLYYRGVASGQLRLSNAVADSGSGPASSTTGALSGTATGWTHTGSTVSTPMGGPFVSAPFSWAAGTTTAPQVDVTGKDVTGNATTTGFTFTNDSTAPTGSAISYADGVTSGRSVTVTLTTGADAGAGIGSRRLQRASATLSSGGGCGTFSNFANLEPAAPTSPYTDSNLSAGTCYKYQYVVTDKLGNQDVVTTTNVAKVDYANAVSTTSGLVSHWRLGEAASTMVAYDSMTGANGATLTAAGRSGEVGATWTLRGGSSTATFFENRVYRASNQGTYGLYQASATPASADYSVEADLHVKSNLTGEMMGVVGRLDPSAATYYVARWEQADTSWNIGKVVAGTLSYPTGWYVTNQGALTVGQNYRLRLEMAGTSLKLFVNGVQKVSVTDTAANAITAPGRAGLLDGNTASGVAKTTSTGLHLDNFQVLPGTYPRATDSKGANTGDYRHGPTLGVAGALAGDANTAAQFDGVNDYMQVTGSTGLPTGAGLRSVETWFKTSSSAQQVLFAYGSITETQEFGLWLNAGGTAMTAWGFGEANGHNKVFTLPAAVNDGAWHHVVKTYDGTTLRLYIDGVALTAQAATRNTVIDAYGFSVGALLNPGTAAFGSFFNGSLDEVALYNTVLSAGTVSDHFALGKAVADTTGPSGGSVDATGLAGTGSRYSTTTTLSIALAKGTDSSGLGTSGAELRRATATLSAGTCGTYGAATLVTNGGDPASPYADTVTDQACYRYDYVVPDVHGNTTTYTSGDIKVDTTAPAAPGLAYSAMTNTAATGSTVYYRSGAASGSFTATATGTDPASAIAGYTFPALGANWSSTPSGTGVNTYAWSGSPAAPGTKSVTATNNAGLVSPSAPFTMVADDTAPTDGTVSYAESIQSSTSVTVSFTTGTDAGAGLGTRLLQRASAVLTGSTCGTYGEFATITGGTNPTSPVVDTVSGGRCHQYRYVVADAVGNTHTATSPHVVKVTSSCGGELVGNPGFENGATTTPWTASAGVVSSAAGEAPARTGSWRAQLGGQGAAATETLSQVVTIPASCSATLTYYLRVTTAETSGPYDKLNVQVVDGATTTVVGPTYTDRDFGTTYVQRTVDLSAYAGKTVTLRFVAVEDVSLQTSFWIDDVSLTAS